MYVQVESTIWWGGVVFPVVWSIYVGIRHIVSRRWLGAKTAIGAIALALCGGGLGAISLTFLRDSQGGVGIALEDMTSKFIWTVVLFHDSVLLSCGSVEVVLSRPSACKTNRHKIHTSDAENGAGPGARRIAIMVKVAAIVAFVVGEVILHSYAVIGTMAE